MANTKEIGFDQLIREMQEFGYFEWLHRLFTCHDEDLDTFLVISANEGLDFAVASMEGLAEQRALDLEALKEEERLLKDAIVVRE
jgi:hypothetical protein